MNVQELIETIDEKEKILVNIQAIYDREEKKIENLPKLITIKIVFSEDNTQDLTDEIKDVLSNYVAVKDHTIEINP